MGLEWPSERSAREKSSIGRNTCNRWRYTSAVLEETLIAEVVTLVVTHDLRSTGVGRALLSSAEDFACTRGFDTVKIAVMRGNARARGFYEANGYAVGEEVLYRRLSDDHRSSEK